MHDLLLEKQKHLDDADLRDDAERVGVDVGAFEHELAEHTHAQRVRDDFMSGVRRGVNGTPTFFINGRRHDGSYELPNLLAALKDAANSRASRTVDGLG